MEQITISRKRYNVENGFIVFSVAILITQLIELCDIIWHTGSYLVDYLLRVQQLLLKISKLSKY